MRRFATVVTAGLLLSAGLVLAQAPPAQAPPAQAPAAPLVAKARATTPEIPYDSISFIKSMPAGLYMGEGIGVATNSKGGVYVFTRSGESRVFEFDSKGVFVKEFGKDSYGYGFAHAVRVDKDDNVWSVDEGTNVILQVHPRRQAPDGARQAARPARSADSMIPGVAPFSGANRPYSFHRPTDISWDPQGNIFVSDGYTDSRVVKYDKNGRFIKSAGTRGNGDLQFSTPHTITVDNSGQRVRRRPRQPPPRRPRQRPQSEGHLGARRCALGNLRLTEHPPQYLYTSNSSARRIDEPTRGDDGRDLQAAARWEGRRPVREGRKGAQGVREHPSDGLPQPERHLHRRDSGRGACRRSRSIRTARRRRRPAGTRRGNHEARSPVDRGGRRACRRCHANSPIRPGVGTSQHRSDQPPRVRRGGRRRHQLARQHLRVRAHRSRRHRDARRRAHLLSRRIASVPVRCRPASSCARSDRAPTR